MYFAAVVFLLQIILWGVLIFLRGSKKYTRLVKTYSKSVVMAVCLVLLIYTTNWVEDAFLEALKEEMERSGISMTKEGFSEYLQVYRSYPQLSARASQDYLESQNLAGEMYNNVVDKGMEEAFAILYYPGIAGTNLAN